MIGWALVVIMEGWMLVGSRAALWTHVWRCVSVLAIIKICQILVKVRNTAFRFRVYEVSNVKEEDFQRSCGTIQFGFIFTISKISYKFSLKYYNMFIKRFIWEWKQMIRCFYTLSTIYILLQFPADQRLRRRALYLRGMSCLLWLRSWVRTLWRYAIEMCR